MTISRTVYNQLFEQSDATKEQVIRLRPTEAKAGAVVMSSSKNRIQMWTNEEHERFLEALERFPSGPWKKIADHIGTKTPRQTMTHAQKYRQKIYRRQRGLRNQRRAGSPSPSRGADVGALSPSAASDGAANAHSRLDILAHSAAVAVAQSSEPQYAAGYAPSYELAQAQAQAHVQAQQQYALRMEMARQTVSTLQPPSGAPIKVELETMGSGAASADVAATAPAPTYPSTMCANSQLPPLAEILHLRGSQVAQQ